MGEWHGTMCVSPFYYFIFSWSPCGLWRCLPVRTFSCYYNYRMYTERRAASENCIVDNAHCIVFTFWEKCWHNALQEKHQFACIQKFTFNKIWSVRSPQRSNDFSTCLYSIHVELNARSNYIYGLYALGFISKLRAIKIIKEQIQ